MAHRFLQLTSRSSHAKRQVVLMRGIEQVLGIGSGNEIGTSGTPAPGSVPAQLIGGALLIAPATAPAAAAPTIAPTVAPTAVPTGPAAEPTVAPAIAPAPGFSPFGSVYATGLLRAYEYAGTW